MRISILILFVFCWLVSGCATKPLPAHDLPEVPAQFRESSTEWIRLKPAEIPPRGEWWKVFNDPVLDRLIERTNQHNTSIQQAAARLLQAMAAAQSAGAPLYPQLNVGGGAVRQGGPLINAAGADGNLFSVNANLSYEIDFIGKLSKASRGAALDAKSSASLLRHTQLIIQAETAQIYLALRMADAESLLVKKMADAMRRSLSLIESRQRAGLAPSTDVLRSKVDIANVESELLALARKRAELEHALAYLSGDLSFGLEVKDFPLDEVPPEIPAGIPGKVLLRRSDVSAALDSVRAAELRLGASQSAWFPNVMLTTSGGYASPQISDLFKLSARAWGIGALISLPVFDGGKRAAAIAGARGELDYGLASYRERILGAVRDVEDQLSALRYLEAQSKLLAQSVEHAEKISKLSQSLYHMGLVSHFEFLDANRTELATRRNLLAVQALRYQSTIKLIRAIGGGWGDIP